eukprot:2789013-Pyramimonas_sp.AAC.1
MVTLNNAGANRRQRALEWEERMIRWDETYELITLVPPHLSPAFHLTTLCALRLHYLPLNDDYSISPMKRQTNPTKAAEIKRTATEGLNEFGPGAVMVQAKVKLQPKPQPKGFGATKKASPQADYWTAASPPKSALIKRVRAAFLGFGNVLLCQTDQHGAHLCALSADPEDGDIQIVNCSLIYIPLVLLQSGECPPSTTST